MFGFMVSRSHGLMFIKLPALFNFAVGVEALREEAFVEDNWSQWDGIRDLSYAITHVCSRSHFNIWVKNVQNKKYCAKYYMRKDIWPLVVLASLNSWHQVYGRSSFVWRVKVNLSPCFLPMYLRTFFLQIRFLPYRSSGDHKPQATVWAKVLTWTSHLHPAALLRALLIHSISLIWLKLRMAQKVIVIVIRNEISKIKPASLIISISLVSFIHDN